MGSLNMINAHFLLAMSLHISDVTAYCAISKNPAQFLPRKIASEIAFCKLSASRSAGLLTMISAQGSNEGDRSRDNGMRTMSKQFPRRIQLRVVEFDVKSRPLKAGSEMMHFLNHLGSALVQRGMRINFIFNSVMDMASARRLIREDIEQNVKLNVLGVGSFGHTEDIAVLVCPCNEGNENLGRIEAVERLLYSGPPASVVSRRNRKEFLQRPIIMINPSLEAIHPHSTPYSKVVPMFMSDFETAYYLDPHIGGRGKLYAGLLRAYPSKDWQLWLRPGDRDEFKLIWERSQCPSEADLSPYLNGEV